MVNVYRVPGTVGKAGNPKERKARTVYWGRRVKENGPREVGITDTKDEKEQTK